MRGAVTETEEESQARRSAAVWASGHEGMNQSGRRRHGEVGTEKGQRGGGGGHGSTEKGMEREKYARLGYCIPVGETERPQQDEERDGREAKRKGSLPSLKS